MHLLSDYLGVLVTLLWVSACQRAQIFWNSNMAANMDREKLKMSIKWSMIAFFSLAAVGPLPYKLHGWARADLATTAYKDLRKIETVAHGIAWQLRRHSHNFYHADFSILNVLTMMAPAQKLIPITIYIPLLTISLRTLYQQSMSQAKMDAIAGSTDGFKQSRFFNSKGDFLHDVTWNEVTFQGLSVPLSFTGNIILLILNLHSYQILDERKAKAQLAKFGASSQGGSIPRKRSAIKTLFLSTMDEEDILLQTVSEELERGATTKYNPANGTADYRSNTSGETKIEQCTFSTNI
ncbi:hypothetical protein PSHT_03389 [Puccinia striiformis]|uniref:Uncharacterized protein n=1 Tax=Puccinia striiformis TaxID=27350 RepID=A0A2S4WFK9_9BASI|nr:hypothetical protein PSHT_03389 [Puccinia striiformis]